MHRGHPTKFPGHGPGPVPLVFDPQASMTGALIDVNISLRQLLAVRK